MKTRKGEGYFQYPAEQQAEREKLNRSIFALQQEIEVEERELGIPPTTNSNINRSHGMNYSTAVFLINDKVRAMACSLDPEHPERMMVFKTFDETIKVDDYVVVPIKNFHKMAVLQVKKVDVDIDFNDPSLVDWIIGIVDPSQYRELVKQEEDAINAVKSAEAKKKRDDLRSSMMAAHADKLGKLKLATPLAITKPKAK